MQGAYTYNGNTNQWDQYQLSQYLYQQPAQTTISPWTSLLMGSSSPGVTITTIPTAPKKEAIMKLVRYYAYYPNIHVAKLNAEWPILLDGTALVAGSDPQRVILDLTEELDKAIDELNGLLEGKTWTNPEGDQKPFAEVRRSDVEFNITSIKEF